MYLLPRPSAFTRAIFCLTIITALLSTSVQADEASREQKIQKVFDHSGVEQHLAGILATVVSESSDAWKECQAKSTTISIQQALDKLLSTDSLRNEYLNQLNDRINDSQLSQILAFIDSEIGRRVFEMEASSGELNDEKMAELIAEFKSNDESDKAANKERAAATNQMLADTGAVYFLSALNTEISTMVIMASVCSNAEADIQQAELNIREERGSEALYRSFLNQQLLLPAIVVYRELAVNELEQISAFSKTDSGNAYYAGLIQSLRTVMALKVGELNAIIRDLPVEN